MESQREYEKEEEALVLKTTKVVEYLVPKMSIELLCKFPDNSAYDFDYSQSTIWSPLLPRPYTPMDLDLITPKKLSYDEKVGSKLRKKFTASTFNLNLDFIRKNSKSKNKKVPSEFSPTPFRGACNPIMNKRCTESCLKTVQEMEGEERPHCPCDATQIMIFLKKKIFVVLVLLLLFVILEFHLIQ
ncbi:hypothetical protein JHK84_055389 [Glycine max]|nr:hypothetical protein JHK84_055389 [Glycine max]